MLDRLKASMFGNEQLAWQADALCGQYGGERGINFFPTSREDPAPAKGICAECPVRGRMPRLRPPKQPAPDAVDLRVLVSIWSRLVDSTSATQNGDAPCGVKTPTST